MFLPSLASQTYFCKRKEGSGELHIQAMSHRNAISKMTYPDFKEYTVWCGRMCHVLVYTAHQTFPFFGSGSGLQD